MTRMNYLCKYSQFKKEFLNSNLSVFQFVSKTFLILISNLQFYYLD